MGAVSSAVLGAVSRAVSGAKFAPKVDLEAIYVPVSLPVLGSKFEPKNFSFPLQPLK